MANLGSKRVAMVTYYQYNIIHVTIKAPLTVPLYLYFALASPRQDNSCFLICMHNFIMLYIR